MKHVRRVLFCIAVVVSMQCSFAANSAVAPEWVGDYSYTETPGRTASDTGTVIERNLTINSSGATLKSEGFQTNETLICDVKCDGSKMQLLFKSYPGGKLTNQYDVAQYKPGQPLLMIQKSITGGKSKLLTTWQAFTLNKPLPNARVYFEKIGNTSKPIKKELH